SLLSSSHPVSPRDLPSSLHDALPISQRHAFSERADVTHDVARILRLLRTGRNKLRHRNAAESDLNRLPFCNFLEKSIQLCFCLKGAYGSHCAFFSIDQFIN